jgi:hypothetical protein
LVLGLADNLAARLNEFSSANTLAQPVSYSFDAEQT